MTLLYVLVAVGTMLSGLAAIGQLVTRWHLIKLRSEVNGLTQDAVANAHRLGVAEGVVHAAAAIGADSLTEVKE